MLVLVVGGSTVGGQALRGLLRLVGLLAVEADQDEGVLGDGVPGLGFQYAAICSVSGGGDCGDDGARVGGVGIKQDLGIG
ncbi:hypothetical protein [Streptomyces venezuelae]